MPSSKPKPRDWHAGTIDLDYLIDSGLLFEFNRQFLHPLGIALVITRDTQGNNHCSFKDCRATPEELLFDKATLERGRKKFESFLRTFAFGQMDRRGKKLGQSVQYVETWV